MSTVDTSQVRMPPCVLQRDGRELEAATARPIHRREVLSTADRGQFIPFDVSIVHDDERDADLKTTCKKFTCKH